MSNQTVIGTHILKYVSLMDLAMVAMYLPSSARAILAQGEQRMKDLVFGHSPRHARYINIDRLQQQLRKSRFGLFNELVALEPYSTSEIVDTLDFIDYNLKDCRFNPVFPVICLITGIVNMLFVYRYGKTGRYARTVLHTSTFAPTEKICKLSWSNDGLFFYLITENKTRYTLSFYRFNPRRYEMRLLKRVPFVERLIGQYLWVGNTGILYSSPDKPNTHLCILTMNKVDILHKRPLGNITDPYTLDYLNQFFNLSAPILLTDIPEMIFFTGHIRTLNPDTGKCTNEYCLIQISIWEPKRKITLYHVPGPIFNLASNGRFLVFTYEGESAWASRIHRHEITSDEISINCKSHYNPTRPCNLLVVAILDSKLFLDYRYLDIE